MLERCGPYGSVLEQNGTCVCDHHLIKGTNCDLIDCVNGGHLAPDGYLNCVCPKGFGGKFCHCYGQSNHTTDEEGFICRTCPFDDDTKCKAMLCLNGGAWNANQTRCVGCLSPFIGKYCEVLQKPVTIDVAEYIPELLLALSVFGLLGICLMKRINNRTIQPPLTLPSYPVIFPQHHYQRNFIVQLPEPLNNQLNQTNGSGNNLPNMIKCNYLSCVMCNSKQQPPAQHDVQDG